MKRMLLRHLPFLVAALLLAAGLGAAGWRSSQVNGGELVYTLDDPYIHMALAKNMASHGVFGITRYGFSSCTSSPLWTLLIVGTYALIGVRDWVPGAWAALFAAAALFVANAAGLRVGLSLSARFVVCLCLLFLTPLIPLVSTGMEHAMHLCLVLVFLCAAYALLESPGRARLALCCVTAALAAAARYETLFVVAPLAAALAYRRRAAEAAAIALASLSPVVAYGVFSLSQGSAFLPNSLLLKGNFPSVHGFKAVASSLGYHSFAVLAETPHVAAVCIALLASAFLLHRSKERELFALAIGLAVAILLHLQFAATGWFYRYEAYLVGAAIVLAGCAFGGARGVLAAACANTRGRAAACAGVVCGALLAWPLIERARQSMEDLVPASRHIHSQQVQMARFLKAMYAPGVRVAANDMGAISYFADVDVLDLWGLATIDVARAKKDGTYDRQTVQRLLSQRGTELVMVYADWFEGLLPQDLLPVGSWRVARPYFGGTVSFFATSPECARVLERKLRLYEKNLPASVQASYGDSRQGRSSIR